MQLEEIKKLANLARIDMGEEEMEGIAHDFESILAYVSQVQEVSKLKEEILNQEQSLDFLPKVKNIMREDVATQNPGVFADKIIEEMPETEGRYLKVKQIL